LHNKQGLIPKMAMNEEDFNDLLNKIETMEEKLLLDGLPSFQECIVLLDDDQKRKLAIETISHRKKHLTDMVLVNVLALMKNFEDFLHYFPAFFYCESYTLFSDFMSKYQQVPKRISYFWSFNQEPISDWIDHVSFGFRIQDEATILNKLDALLTDEPFDEEAYKSVLDGILKSRRFDLFNRGAEKFSQHATKALDLSESSHPQDIESPTREEIVQEMKAVINFESVGKLSDDLQHYLNQENAEENIIEVFANISMFLQNDTETFKKILDDLSEQLYKKLEDKQTGLAAEITQQFPLPKEEDFFYFFDKRHYPKISALNPNQVKIKKYSALKELLHQYFIDIGATPPEVKYPDKYLGPVTDDTVLERGIFTEASWTIVNHGKLTHMLHMVCHL